MEHLSSQKDIFAGIYKHPNDTIIALMKSNIRDARQIYELSKNSGCLDSQEFISWQDELNKISVKYE
jgi:hypothetical protein